MYLIWNRPSLVRLPTLAHVVFIRALLQVRYSGQGKLEAHLDLECFNLGYFQALRALVLLDRGHDYDTGLFILRMVFFVEKYLHMRYEHALLNYSHYSYDKDSGKCGLFKIVVIVIQLRLKHSID